MLANAYERGSADVKQVIEIALNAHGLDEAKRFVAGQKLSDLNLSVFSGIGGIVLAYFTGFLSLTNNPRWNDSIERFLDVSSTKIIIGLAAISSLAIIGAVVLFRNFRKALPTYFFEQKNPKEDPDWHVGPPPPIARERREVDAEGGPVPWGGSSIGM